MNWNDYQEWTASKAAPIVNGVLCDSLGLAGESGEVCDLVKKLHYHQKPVTAQKMCGELGDIMYYLARVAGHFGLTLQEVMERNVLKLNARYPDGFDPARAHSPGETPVEELEAEQRMRLVEEPPPSPAPPATGADILQWGRQQRNIDPARKEVYEEYPDDYNQR